MRARPGARPAHERTCMPGHTLLVHPDVDEWMLAQPDLRRRVDWLLFELGTRGDAGRPEGMLGAAPRAAGRASSGRPRSRRTRHRSAGGAPGWAASTTTPGGSRPSAGTA